MAVTINEWCKGAGTGVAAVRSNATSLTGVRLGRYVRVYGGMLRRPTRVTCPVCKRRLIPETVNAEPYNNSFDPIYRIPKHKSKR